MRSITKALAIALVAASWGCSDDPAALMASAKRYMAQGDFNASVIQLKNVLQKTPQNGEARYLLGLASLEQGDPIAAQIELDKAAELGFGLDEVQLALARTALAKGEPDKLLERFGGKTLSTPNAQAELPALIGMSRLAKGQTAEAQRTFDDALKLDATNVTATLGSAR